MQFTWRAKCQVTAWSKAGQMHVILTPSLGWLWLVVALGCAGVSCSTVPTRLEDRTQPAADGDSVWEVLAWHQADDLPGEIARLETVFWDPRDTVSLRQLISQTPLVKDKTVLEIGTGTGLLSLYALEFGAAKVVASDVNPAAVTNARYNARLLNFEDRFQARLVSLDDPAAFSVIADEETFDVILSNPPWVNRRPSRIEEFALYDENFQLMRTLLEGLRQHLNPGGGVLLAYGSVDGIRTLMRMARGNEHDDRGDRRRTRPRGAGGGVSARDAGGGKGCPG